MAACLDLGLRSGLMDLAYLESKLALLDLAPGSYALKLENVERCSLQARKFDVNLLPLENRANDAGGADDLQERTRQQSHHNEHKQKHDAEHNHEHGRGLSEILNLIQTSRLDDEVKELASRIFSNLGRAEAQVHGVSVDDIHFHEVGSIDAIVDIVGFSICYRRLGIERAFVSALPLGGGVANTMHGRLPVPGPAVLNLLSAAGAPISGEHLNYECLTPTGAAILTTIASGWGRNPAFESVSGIGYGAGTLNPSEHPNVLRILYGCSQSRSQSGERLEERFHSEMVAVVEANIDDCSPQILAHTLENLLAKGALDVAFCPLTMKKSRPGHKLSVICRPQDRHWVQKFILQETTSLGVRSYICERLVEEREYQEVKLGDSAIRIKIGRDENGKVINVHPEFEDLARYARENGVSLKEVLQQGLLKMLGENIK